MDVNPPLPPPPPGGEPEADEVTPQGDKRSAAKAVAVVAAFGVALAGVVAAGFWWLGGPSICGPHTVESARFGYCVAAPGWEFTNDSSDTQLPYDELIKPADASTVRIVAIQLEGGQGLDDIVKAVRNIESEDGVELTDVVDRRVAGVPAAQWDISLGEGAVAQQVREVVFVRGGAAWRVQLQADTDGFRNLAQEFEDILRSWTFR
jgi:hypothetical protein